jgi:hypothetical protein
MCFGIEKESEIVNKVAKLVDKLNQIELCHSTCKNWPCKNPEKCVKEKFRFFVKRENMK